MEKRIDVTKFDLLDESGEILKGGFSVVYSGGGFGSKESELTMDDVKNVCETKNKNCENANCVLSCGK